MGLAGMSLGRELRAPSSEPHRFGAAWHRLRTRSQTRVQTCALTQQMIGPAHQGHLISPCVKSASAKLFLDLHTVLAPSGERSAERVQPHRSNALRYASAA